MSKFKVGDRVRDITKHSAMMGLEKAGEGNLASLSEHGWTVSWDNKMMGPIAWEDDQLELVVSPKPVEGPARTRTVTEIVPGTYGRVRINIGLRGTVLLGVEDGIDTQQTHWTAHELRALCSLANSLAEALEENAK